MKNKYKISPPVSISPLTKIDIAEESGNMHKEMCIKQGYIPPYCKLNGMIVWLLIKDGKNPCDGCNCNCPNRILKDKLLNKHVNCNNDNLQNVLSIATDIKWNNKWIIEIKVSDLCSQRGYIANCESPEEAIYYICKWVHEYNIKSVICEINGLGKDIYQQLLIEHLDVNIVPINYRAVKY